MGEGKFTFTIDEVEIQRDPYHPSAKLGQRVNVGLISSIYEIGPIPDLIDYPRNVNQKYLSTTISHACRKAITNVGWK